MRARQSKTPKTLAAGGHLWRAGLALLLLALTAYAEQLPVKHYTTAEGLLRDNVTSIVQDSRGFLWFCTPSGLSRFDGYQFTHYTTDDGLPHQEVTGLLEARDGTIWVATSGGLCRFNPKGARAPLAQNGKAPMFSVIVPSDERYTKAFTVLFQDEPDVIWCGTLNGLYRLEVASLQFQKIELGRPSNPGFYSTLAISAISRDRRGALWVGTENSGLYRLLPAGQPSALVEHFTPTNGLPHANVASIAEDKDGKVWIGMAGSGGLCRLVAQPAAGHPVVVRCYTKQDGLRADWVAGLLPAADGSLWIGTTSGLNRLMGWTSDGQPRFQTYTEAQGLTDREVLEMTEDREGNLWLASSSGALKWARNGFTRYDTRDGLYSTGIDSIFENDAAVLYVTDNLRQRTIHPFSNQRFSAIRPNVSAQVKYWGWGLRQTVLNTHDGEWWVPTGHGQLYRFPKVNDAADLARVPPKAVYTKREGLLGTEVFLLYEDARRDLWIVTLYHLKLLRWERATGKFINLTQAAGLSDDQLIWSITEDRAGNLWLGTSGKFGLLRYRAGHFTQFGKQDGLPGSSGGQTFLDQAGRLWIGSRRGLVRIDDPAAARPQFTVYTTAQGLSDNEVISVTGDRWGRIYCGTGRALDRLDPATGQVKHFTAADGLPKGTINTAYHDRQGALWFGTSFGLARFVPEPERPRQPPNIFLTGLRVAGLAQPVSELGEAALAPLALSAAQNQVSVDFLGLGASLGEELRYQYRLEGAEGAWSQPEARRTVDFASLAPGAYRFIVRAVTAEGVASAQPASVAFTIKPPVWQRGWFIALMSLTLGLAGYAGYRYRVAQLLAVERLRTHISSDLHDDIGANLARITILSEVAKQQLGQRGNGKAATPLPDELLSTIAGISRESVAALRDIVWAINPQRDNLRDLTRKLREHAEEVFTLREITLRFSAPDERQHLKLPVDVRRDLLLLFKEALNNAARHSACQRIEIDLGVAGSTLSLRIADDGVGFDPAAESEGNGLVSMQRRARNLRGALTIETQPGQGTTIRLTLPLPRKLARG